MTIPVDVPAIMENAFKVSKTNARRLSDTSLSVKDQQVKLEDIIRQLLMLLCEHNIVDINLERMAEIGWAETGKFANQATFAISLNQAERLAAELNEATPDYLEKMCRCLSQETRQRLAVTLAELDR